MPDRSKLHDSPERRVLAAEQFELRAEGDTLTLTGYASVFNKGYDLYGGPAKGGWTEFVHPDAFKRTLSEKPDLHLLINHEGMPLARTKSGTLRLSTDKVGLKVEADLDRNDPDVQRLETKMKRGDMDEMSFAFRVLGQKWEDDDEKRTLTEVSLHKGDVSVVNFGANPATSASIRSLNDAIKLICDAEETEALAELRSGDQDEILSRLADATNILTGLRRSMQPKKTGSYSLEEYRKVIAETAATPPTPGIDAT
jgi:HK97 family phage prohead protease